MVPRQAREKAVSDTAELSFCHQQAKQESEDLRGNEPPYDLDFSVGRRLALVGLAAGLAAPFAASAAFAISASPFVQALVMEALIATPAVGASLMLFPHPERKLSSVALAYLPRAAAFPGWLLYFAGVFVPIAGFHGGIPPYVLPVLFNVPYLVYLSHCCTHPSPQIPTPPFALSDLCSKQTALSVGWGLGCAWANCMGQVIAQQVGAQGEIFDPLFAVLPFVNANFIQDLFVLGGVCLLVGHSLWRQGPATFPVVLRRVLVIYGGCLLCRAVTAPLFATFLPAPDAECIPNFSPDTPLPLSGLFVLAGVYRTCRDVMFSGHTVIAMLPALYFQKYSQNRTLQLGVWGWTGMSLLSLVMTHGHYTADVVIGMGVTVGFWEVAHNHWEQPYPDAVADSPQAGIITRSVRYLGAIRREEDLSVDAEEQGIAVEEKQQASA